MAASRRYTLLYGDLDLGEVAQRDVDFPNCFGRWIASAKDDNRELRSRIRAYVEYSEHADSLMSPDITPEWEAYVREREPEFADLIESDQWALRDDRGLKDWILVPRFCVGGGIVWRYNPGRAV